MLLRLGLLLLRLGLLLLGLLLLRLLLLSRWLLLRRLRLARLLLRLCGHLSWIRRLLRLLLSRNRLLMRRLNRLDLRDRVRRGLVNRSGSGSCTELLRNGGVGTRGLSMRLVGSLNSSGRCLVSAVALRGNLLGLLGLLLGLLLKMLLRLLLRLLRNTGLLRLSIWRLLLLLLLRTSRHRSLLGRWLLLSRRLSVSRILLLLLRVSSLLRLLLRLLLRWIASRLLLLLLLIRWSLLLRLIHSRRRLLLRTVLVSLLLGVRRVRIDRRRRSVRLNVFCRSRSRSVLRLSLAWLSISLLRSVRLLRGSLRSLSCEQLRVPAVDRLGLLSVVISSSRTALSGTVVVVNGSWVVLRKTLFHHGLEHLSGNLKVVAHGLELQSLLGVLVDQLDDLRSQRDALSIELL